jgi:hypothetical protein
MDSEVAEENRFGKTLRSIKVIGLRIKQMEGGDLCMERETFIKENGEMIKHMEKGFIQNQMVLVLLGNGWKIFNMVSVFRNRLMLHLIKGNYMYSKNAFLGL